MWRAVKNRAPTAEYPGEDPGDSYNAQPEPEPEPELEVKPDPAAGKWNESPVGLTLAGFSSVAGTHKVTVSFFATSPGAQLIALGTNEARLLARSIVDWANYCDDLAAGKKA